LPSVRQRTFILGAKLNQHINSRIATAKLNDQLIILKSLTETHPNDNSFKEWNTAVLNLIEDLFGIGSRQYRDFKAIKYYPAFMVLGDPSNEETLRCALLDGLKKADVYLRSLIAYIKEYWIKDMNRPKMKETTTMNQLRIFNERRVWEEIGKDFDYSRNKFGRKISFVKDAYKRKVIFRDIAQAFYLAKMGCYKPGVILAGGVIEELLNIFLQVKGLKPQNNTFSEYIKCCEENHLLKSGISKLSHSVREFRNLVHLDNEHSEKYTLSKATAIGAVSSVFTIINDF
jgi:hypothetical protein